MQTPNNDEATARRTLVANAAKERRDLCLDVLAIEGLDHWEKPLEKAGLLEVRHLLQSENGLAHSGAVEVPPPSPLSDKAKVALYSKIKGADEDGGLPDNADEAKAELRSVLGAFGRSLDTYDCIASRLRDGMRTPAVQTPSTGSTVAVGAGQKRPVLKPASNSPVQIFMASAHPARHLWPALQRRFGDQTKPSTAPERLLRALCVAPLEGQEEAAIWSLGFKEVGSTLR